MIYVGKVVERKGSDYAGKKRVKGSVEVLRVESTRILEDKGLIDRVVERRHGKKGGLVAL